MLISPKLHSGSPFKIVNLCRSILLEIRRFKGFLLPPLMPRFPLNSLLPSTLENISISCPVSTCKGWVSFKRALYQTVLACYFIVAPSFKPWFILCQSFVCFVCRLLSLRGNCGYCSPRLDKQKFCAAVSYFLLLLFVINSWKRSRFVATTCLTAVMETASFKP